MSALRGHLRPISVAPMMDCTDRHFRWLMRQITRRTLLYTEMVTMQAIAHGDREHLLGFSEVEHPISLQLGGDNPSLLAECARVAEGMGYDEVNLNVGCPSDRVANGNFGACLMAAPERVAACVAAMRGAVAIPVTVKHRIGIDDQDSYEHMRRFVDIVVEAGCDRFSVHARKAILGGLSPKENRTIPPLRYLDVYRLKAELPAQVVEINGGIRSFDDAAVHLRAVDAVMIGRAAYDDPYLFAAADARFFADEHDIPTRGEIAMRYAEYAERWLAAHPRQRFTLLARHALGLFTGQPSAREYRRLLSSQLPGSPTELLGRAVEAAQQALAARAASS